MRSKRHSTLAWVLGLALVALVFDGYDLVIYGAVMPEMREPGGLIFQALSPEHQQALQASIGLDKDSLTDPMREAIAAASAIGGSLGSYALIGVLVGALALGTFGDRVGRRIPMLGSIAWLSIGMAITATTESVLTFGIMRFITGLGIGALVATTAAIISEFAPAGRKNLANAIVYSGVPLGSMLSALAAILWLDDLGWRGLFWIGALPLVTLLPLAYFKLPESVLWLEARGQHDEALAASEATGVPVPADPIWPPVAKEKSGFATLFTRQEVAATFLLGGLSATGLLLVYSLNTWLPQLTQPALGEQSSLALLLALNLGAVIGGLTGSLFADRFGVRNVIAAFFGLGAVGIVLATTAASPRTLVLLIVVIALVGMGTSGTQTLIYGFVANYYPVRSRAAAGAGAAGFGRLGGVAGPLLGGLLAALFPEDLPRVFYVLAGFCVLGVVLALAVPRRDPVD